VSGNFRGGKYTDLLFYDSDAPPDGSGKCEMLYDDQGYPNKDVEWQCSNGWDIMCPATSGGETLIYCSMTLTPHQTVPANVRCCMMTRAT